MKFCDHTNNVALMPSTCHTLVLTGSKIHRHQGQHHHLISNFSYHWSDREMKMIPELGKMGTKIELR